MEEDQIYICFDCIGDDYLKEMMQKNNNHNKCLYCEKNQETISMEELCELLKNIIENHYFLTPDEPVGYEYTLVKDKEIDYEWVRSGELLNFVLQELVGVDEDIANDIQEFISETYGDHMEYIEEDPYGDEAHYLEKEPDGQEFQNLWSFFKTIVITRGRFLNKNAEDILKELFSNLDSLKTVDGESVIKKITDNSRDRYIYRGRVSQSQESLKEILKDPVLNLSPPLPKVAKSGRMNAEGISVFYGAKDIDTCISEVRPPVGSTVVIGKFEIIRDVNILDFDVLREIHVRGSHFDPKYAEKLEQAFFLEHLVNELTKPVMPNDESLDYIPIQIVAEYLANQIDGIIFHSSQTAGEGKNIVLFNHSSRVKPKTLPKGSKVSVSFGWGTEDDYDDSITIFEEIAENKTVTAETNTRTHGGIINIDHHLFNDLDFEDSDDYRKFTLSLDINSMQVHEIKAVSYETNNRHISKVCTASLES